MSRSHRPAVQKYHDRVAGVYDHSYDDAYWQWHDRLTWDYLKPFLPRELRTKIVDLGCGTGKWSSKLLAAGYTITCVDISAQMLDQARAKLSHTGGSHRCTYVQADICDLSGLPEGCFGLAIAMGEPIGCSSSPARALHEIRRILTEDGILVATLDNRLAAVEFYLRKGDSKELERFLRDGKTHWLTNATEERFPVITFAPGHVRKFFESAGFTLLDMVGKTVLSMRSYRHLLESSDQRRDWTKIEKSLARDPYSIGRASHLQVACRVTKQDLGQRRSLTRKKETQGISGP